MLLLAAYAGLRRGEIAGLAWADIDTDNDLIQVTGKGRHQRVVPLSPVVRDALTAERYRRRTGQFGPGWRFTPDPRSPFVFPGRSEGHMSPDSVGAILTGILGSGWTAHTLRHRFGTTAYKKTKDLRAVQELLGHSKPETSARYAAVDADDLRAAVLAVADDF